MGWFKGWGSQVAVQGVSCRECRVYFAPDADPDAPFAHYCPTHRQPRLEKQWREDTLVAWTKQHLDLVEKLKAREDKKEAKRRKNTPELVVDNGHYRNLATQQTAAYNACNTAFSPMSRTGGLYS